MDIKDRKQQLVQGLTLIASGSALAHGYKFDADDMTKIAQPLIESGIDGFISEFQRQTSPGIDEEALYNELFDIAARNVIIGSKWVAEKIPASTRLDQEKIRHAIHEKLQRLDRAEYVSLKSFFPFGKYRE